LRALGEFARHSKKLESWALMKIFGSGRWNGTAGWRTVMIEMVGLVGRVERMGRKEVHGTVF